MMKGEEILAKDKTILIKDIFGFDGKMTVTSKFKSFDKIL